MKKPFFLLFFLAVQTVLFAQEYFPEGTKWTEIRLDTMRHVSWYSKVGNEWIPNFEAIDYYVKEEYIDNNGSKYKCVYTNGPEWTDSLTLLIQERHNSVLVSVLTHDYEGNSRPLYPGEAYQFDWIVGKGLYFTDILMSNTTYAVRYECYYGIIDEIKEGYFGGVRPMKYVDLDGKAPECGQYDNPQKVDTQGGRIIQGIGITEWNDGECLFGASRPYYAAATWDSNVNVRNYRSMLVHFERNGEVLYDVWPEKKLTEGIKPMYNEKTPNTSFFFDLQGRRLSGQPQRGGVYIQNGRKILK